MQNEVIFTYYDWKLHEMCGVYKCSSEFVDSCSVTDLSQVNSITSAKEILRGSGEIIVKSNARGLHDRKRSPARRPHS